MGTKLERLLETAVTSSPLGKPLKVHKKLVHGLDTLIFRHEIEDVHNQHSKFGYGSCRTASSV